VPATATVVNPTLTGGTPLSPANYYHWPTNPPAGGYAYTYIDPSNATNVGCLNGSTFCAAGNVGTTGYGVGVGVAINQASGTNTAKAAYAIPSTELGVSYSVTALPANTVLIIDNNGVAYQAKVTANSAMVPWSMFAVQTPDAGPPTLTGAPTATQLQFQINPATAAASFNFCVVSLAFYP
jgi:hypothetical protein